MIKVQHSMDEFIVPEQESTGGFVSIAERSNLLARILPEAYTLDPSWPK